MDARTLAARVLLRVEKEGAFASAALSSALEREMDLDPRDRGLATELVYGVLRWRGILDDAIARRAPRGIDRLDTLVRIHLEVGAYQIFRLRIPAPAAVSVAVEAVKADRGARMAGFANAVLRAVAADPGPADEDTRARLALPAWMNEALTGDLGALDARVLALSSLEVAPTFVRTNLRRISAEVLADRIRSERPGTVVHSHPAGPGALRVETPGDLASLPVHGEGLFTVQDAAAQAVAALVAPRAGERILDACAGRGGKTGALVEAADGDVSIDAADDHPAKLDRLVAELARLGHAGVRTVPVDLTVGVDGLAPPYDAALVDAPCSGIGVVARRPELRWRVQPDDVARLVALQRSILGAVAPLVRPGGRLVYAVCSLLSSEGPGAIAAFRAANAGFSVRTERRWLPHRDGTDGFYAAVLDRC